MAYKSKLDQAKACRKHYDANKQKMILRAKEATKKTTDLVNALIKEIKSQPCTDCKICYPYYIMQFDHIIPGSKKFTIANRGKWTSFNRVKAEIDKCEVVCANCHCERTHKRRIEVKEKKAA